MDPSIDDILQTMKDDNAFFVNLQQGTNANFSLEKEDSVITNKEREIRWFYYANLIFDSLIKENSQLKENQENYLKNLDLKIDNFIKAQDEKISNIIASQNDIVDSISDLNDRFDQLYDKQIVLEENHSPIGSSTFVASQAQIKLIAPKFSGENYERPIHFLNNLKIYFENAKICDKDSVSLLVQSLENTALTWYYTVRSKIFVFEDFEKYFKARFWNEPIQSSLRTKLEIGKFNPDRKKSRVVYAQNLLEIAMELD